MDKLFLKANLNVKKKLVSSTSREMHNKLPASEEPFEI